MEKLNNEVLAEVEQNGVEESYKSGSMQYMDSREVAEIIRKPHNDLLKSIRRYEKHIEELNKQEGTQGTFSLTDFFIESSYKDASGKINKSYLITKKGCEFIAHKLTGIKGTKFTATYLERLGGERMELMEQKHGKYEKTITTLEIAEMMGMEHWQILRKLEGRETKGKHIKGYIEILNDNQMVVVDYFIKSSYTDDKGETRPCYLVTKLGCDFLANKFTGEKGVIFTAKYVKRFHEMEDTIKSGELVQVQELTKRIDDMQALILNIAQKQNLLEQENTANKKSANPYGASNNDGLEERKKELYSLTEKVAKLCKMSQTKILHYMYRTIEGKLGVTLDAYKSVYMSETGNTNACMVEVIAADNRLYETATQMNREVIERKQIYG